MLMSDVGITPSAKVGWVAYLPVIGREDRPK